MPFQLSPGVNVSEIDLTTVIPAVATTDGAIGGVFKWGPADKATLVVSEDELAREYGRPDSDNAETWMTAANFLAYSNRLYVSRAHHSTGTDVKIGTNLYMAAGDKNVIITANVTTGVKVGFGAIADNEAALFAGVAEVESIDTATISDTFTAAGANNTITGDITSTFVEGERVQFTTDGTLPTGLSLATDYYLVNVESAGFQVSTTRGGSVASITEASGTGTHTLTRSGDTRIVLDKASTTSADGSIEFYDGGYSFNAIANTVSLGSNGLLSQHIVINEDRFDNAEASFDDNVLYVAKYGGELGNSLRVSTVTSADAFESKVNVPYDAGFRRTFDLEVGSNTASFTTTDATESSLTDITDDLQIGDLLRFGNTTIGYQYNEITAFGSATTAGGNTTIEVSFADPHSLSEDVALDTDDDSIGGAGETGFNFDRYWKHYGLVEKAPGQSTYVAEQGNTAANDEMHIVVIDEDGKISGTPNGILEVFQGLSRATDAKDADGADNYYKTIVNQTSKYIYIANDDADAPSATAQNVASSTETLPTSVSMRYGKDVGTESTSAIGDTLRAYDVFKNTEDYDISLVMTGKTRGGSNGTQLANYIIDNLCEVRRDCVALISPEKADTVDNFGDITEDVLAFRNSLRSTSYAVLDSGYKYQYDKYNDVYRWVPLNGDIAGLCARTDDTRDPWYSPAGLNRGQIKNAIKLAWNPQKGERDVLYSNAINPVVNFPGDGIVMFGDKTLLSRPSAFDRINVRRLFIVLEKAISRSSKFALFEFNDEFTRSTFVNLVTPFLRNVKARRGITDFVVVCDETNNPGDVIDRNEFVGDIYIKPARSINFIQLNFVAVRSGVEFSEVIGNI